MSGLLVLLVGLAAALLVRQARRWVAAHAEDSLLIGLVLAAWWLVTSIWWLWRSCARIVIGEVRSW